MLQSIYNLFLREISVPVCMRVCAAATHSSNTGDRDRTALRVTRPYTFSALENSTCIFCSLVVTRLHLDDATHNRYQREKRVKREYIEGEK